MRDFVDRSAERGLLEDACADSASTKVVVVDGIPGVGKSALVKKWGNEKRIDHFSDGQIYLDFAASEEGGASPVADMLRSKLSQMIGPDAVSRTRPSDLPPNTAASPATKASSWFWRTCPAMRR